MGHPLAHRLRLRWLRPVSVRLALAGLVLATVATTILTPSEKTSAPGPEPAPAMSAAAAVPSATQAVPESPAIATHIIVFAFMAIRLAVTPLLIVHGSVWIVGPSVLPTCADDFETPPSSCSAA